MGMRNHEAQDSPTSYGQYDDLRRQAEALREEGYDKMADELFTQADAELRHSQIYGQKPSIAPTPPSDPTPTTN